MRRHITDNRLPSWQAS